MNPYKECIVTGGNGFIGSNMVDALVDKGYDVIVIDNLSSQCHENFYFNKSDKVQYFDKDICDYDQIESLFKDVDFVFHMAAESRIQSSIDNPLQCIRTNEYGTACVLQASAKHKVKKVVYASTSAIYGNNCQTDGSMESDDVNPLNPYSMSKLNGERLCMMYKELFGLKVVIFRYFNVYGDREPIKGEYAPVVGRFLKQKKDGVNLTVVGDGSKKRDFVHVKDVVKANLLSTCEENAFFECDYGHPINLGSGVNYSIFELARMISNKIEFIKDRPMEAQETLACMSLFNSIFGCLPEQNIIQYIEEKLKEIQ